MLYSYPLLSRVANRMRPRAPRRSSRRWSASRSQAVGLPQFPAQEFRDRFCFVVWHVSFSPLQTVAIVLFRVRGPDRRIRRESPVLPN